AAVLTDLITSGQIEAGQFLPSEQELCRQLGVSRATVREALRMLETRGLVSTRHGVGVQVSDESHRVVSESIGLLLRRRGVGPTDILEVRLILDCQAAALAAQRATAEDLATLERAIERLHQPDLDVESRIVADLDFHIALTDAAKNVVLAALVHALRDLLHDTIAATFAVDSAIARRLDEHRLVLAGVRAGDATAASQAMRQHLLATEDLVRYVSEIGGKS
ncbi:MAG: FadR family transcriptional regulator, partial [Chloroflexia bacterium]|nr:FadR family transcriptional regulator [Chloroflexia bacterium]